MSARCRPGGRLVQDVQHVLAAPEFAQLAGQLDALSFAAGERGGGLAQREIAQAQLVQHADLLGDRRLVLEERLAILDRHVQHVGDGLALVVTSSVSGL